MYWCDNSVGTSESESGAKYYLKSEGTDYCIAYPSDINGPSAQLVQQDCNGLLYQQWIMTHVQDQIYTFKNVAGDNKSMDVDYFQAQQQGGQVQGVRQFPNHPAQQFKLVPRNGNFHIISIINGRIIWSNTSGKLRHWEYDAGQDYKLVKV